MSVSVDNNKLLYNTEYLANTVCPFLCGKHRIRPALYFLPFFMCFYPFSYTVSLYFHNRSHIRVNNPFFALKPLLQSVKSTKIRIKIERR